MATILYIFRGLDWCKADRHSFYQPDVYLHAPLCVTLVPRAAFKTLDLPFDSIQSWGLDTDRYAKALFWTTLPSFGNHRNLGSGSEENLASFRN